MSEQSPIPVFLASDENYAPMVLTTIISAMEHTKSPVSWYILSDEITLERQKIIIDCLHKWKNCSVDFIPVDRALFENFPTPENYISKASYLRVFVPEIRKNLTRVIYSDVDVIFTGDVSELYNEDLDGKIIGVVPDVHYQMNYNANDIYERLLLPESHEYFYSGMILMDAEKWRKEDVTRKLLAIAKKFGDRIKQGDQDLLNIHFSCNYKELDPKYEVTNLLIEYKKKLERSKQRSVCHPVIRHYESAFKPWNSKKFFDKKMHDFRLWWKYAKKTPWYKELLEKFRNR